MSVRGNQYVEARRVVELLRDVLNQSKIAENRPTNWEQLFRTADYHNVANILYYAMLRMRQDIPKEWKNQFSQKYRRAVISEEQYKNVVEAIFWHCEEEGIHILALEDYILRSYYPMPEMRALTEVTLLVEKHCRPEVDRLMHSMDFVPIVGEYCYERSGLVIRFLEKFPFDNKKTGRIAGGRLKFLPRVEDGRYVHEYREPGLFVFLMGCKAQRFAMEQFDIRDLLDIWLYYRSQERGKNWTTIMKRLKKLRLWEFTDRMLTLAGSWFGGTVIEWEEELYGSLEAFIFTKGAAGRSAALQILPLLRIMAKRRAMEDQKKEPGNFAGWVFPDQEYMRLLYPRMGKHRIFLPLCWVRRLLRGTLSAIGKKLFGKKKDESVS